MSAKPTYWQKLLLMYTPYSWPTHISNPQTKNQYIVDYIWIKLGKNQNITSPPQKIPGLYYFIGELDKTFKEELTILQNLLQKIKEKEIPSNALYEVIVMLIPKPDTESTKGENCTQTSKGRC